MTALLRLVKGLSVRLPWHPPRSSHWAYLVENYEKYRELDRVLREDLTGEEIRETLWRLYRAEGCYLGENAEGIVDWFAINTIDYEYLRER